MSTSISFIVYGSHGELLVDRERGSVESYSPDAIAEYGKIAQFDTHEWANHYWGDELSTGRTAADVLDDHIDILDLGYWMHDGSYEPAALRDEHQLASDHPHLKGKDWLRLTAENGGHGPELPPGMIERLNGEFKAHGFEVVTLERKVEEGS